MGFIHSIFFIIFPIIINQFVLHLPVVAAKSVLSQGDKLDTTSTLISDGGSFTLGFFTINPTTNFTYLGIWHTNDTRKVWVANRDTPMIPGGGSLVIDDSGTLKVIREINNTNTTLFNVSSKVSSWNTRAVLNDLGNFVLYDVANGNRLLWESFDHPTDTLLPGMRLGYNLITGQNWTLTSWLTDQIPASGAFTLRLEQIQNSPQLVIYRHEKVYWYSGPWVEEDEKGDRLTYPHFEFLELSDTGVYTGILDSDASGMYFAIGISSTTSWMSMLQLTTKGGIIDQANSDMHTPTFCYGYQSHDGCAISVLPNCRGKSDSFRLKSGDWTESSYVYTPNISLNDCMERCWNDCECNGFNTINNDDGTGCRRWTTKAGKFKPDESGASEAKYVLVSRHPKKNTWIWVVSVAIVLTSTLAVFLCYVKIQRRKLEEEKRRRVDYIHQLTGSRSFNYGDELEKDIKDAPDVKIFSLRAILAATDNFSNENKLGQGGYGLVYKGKLFDGQQIAVKRLSKTSGQGIEEFKSELILISKLQHKNLVRLCGCCIHQEEKMLINEFMPNKSLDFFLFDEDNKKAIDWRMRFNVIEGVAQGLLYLHKYSRMKVIHRDLKVSNVLLDENMNPKIADFGMARIFQHNVSEEITNRVVGTRGYMAPEYVMGGTFSINSDVFSFGILILEIVSGKRNSNFYNVDRAVNLIGYAWELWKEDTTIEFKDESLEQSCDLKHLLRTIHVGLLCVQENAVDRPTMTEVISMLNNEIADLPCPKKPAFLICTQSSENLQDKNITVSVNRLTITMMEAR